MSPQFLEASRTFAARSAGPTQNAGGFSGAPMSVLERVAPSNPVAPLERLLREGVLAIDPTLAARILAEANYEGQRKVKRDQVLLYVEMMQRELWGLTDPIFFARLNGHLVLVNGQHRLHAVIAFGRAVTFRIAINDCASERDLRSLYWRFDNGTGVRSWEQLQQAAKLSESLGVNKQTVSAVRAAVGVIANDFRIPGGRGTTTEAYDKLAIADLRFDACEDWADEARKLEDAISAGSPKVRRLIRRASTYAVALMTMRHQPAKAEVFWRGVAENDGLRRGDPRHAFLRDLTNRGGSDGMKDQFIIAAAVAWNAFFEGRSLSIIKVHPESVVRIAGTPVGSRRP